MTNIQNEDLKDIFSLTLSFLDNSHLFTVSFGSWKELAEFLNLNQTRRMVSLVGMQHKHTEKFKIKPKIPLYFYIAKEKLSKYGVFR